MSKIAPTIGNWYKAKELENVFEVVAFDEASNLVEIQYYEGEIEEIDADDWKQLHITEISEPDDWTGPYEMNLEDTDEFLEDVHHPIIWENPVSMLDQTHDAED